MKFDMTEASRENLAIEVKTITTDQILMPLVNAISISTQTAIQLHVAVRIRTYCQVASND